ncbi:serine protease Hayan-like [Malaya genurostris]|uniref:serine protease Hayan-like n=1 Tax=Malaya genurostris TaxID=325434 RepID=UPI0026F3C043|nr:serine protease Hayan-like [Malaya genurostris]
MLLTKTYKTIKVYLPVRTKVNLPGRAKADLLATNTCLTWKSTACSTLRHISFRRLQFVHSAHFERTYFDMIPNCILLILIVVVIQPGKSQRLANFEGAHVALIGWTDPTDGSIKFDCTGSYLGRNMILTGARCLERNGTRANVVRLGEAIGLPRDFEVDNVSVHYRYQAEYYYHNMAIIFLKENPQMVSSRFKPACIFSVEPPLDIKVHVVGRDSRGSFQKTSVDLVGSDKCHEYYTPTKKFKYGALLVCCMCARNPTTQNCASELASPMQTILEKNGKRVPFLVGQKTIGKSCGSKIPGIYTRLSSDGHLPWISTIAAMDFKDHDACIERY